MSRLLRAYTLALLAAIYLPVIVVAVYSFNEGKYIGRWEGFTLKWYLIVASDHRTLEAVYNSITVAAASASISTLMAVLAAFSVKDRRPPTAIDVAIYPPLVLPEIAEAIALLLMLSALGFKFGWLTVFIGHTAFNVAYAYVVVASALRGHQRLEEAARVLGASKMKVLTSITLPLSLPGIVVALAFTGLLSFTDFIKTLFTTGPGFETLPLLLWNRARRPGLTPYSTHSALSALATLMIASSLLIALIYTIYLFRQLEKK